MRSKLLNGSILLIKNNTNYDDMKIEEIRYGLEVLYIAITKAIVVLLLGYLLSIMFEQMILIIFYFTIRMFAFGAHAKKNYQCWISTIIIYLSFPFLIRYTYLNYYTYIFVSLVSSLIIIYYAPADTEKRPLINHKKRIKLKLLTLFICFVYVLLIIFIDNRLILNSIVFSLILQSVVVLPITYKIFKLTYKNYRYYDKERRTYDKVIS